MTTKVKDPIASSIEDLSLCARLLVEALCRIWPGDLTDVARGTIVERLRLIEARLAAKED